MNFTYQNISKASCKVDRIITLLSSIKFFIFYFIIIFCSLFFDWNEWVFKVAILIAFLHAIYILFSITIVSPLLYKHSKFAFNDEFVSIYHGTLTISHIIIPISKIQGVLTFQNLTMQRNHVKSVNIATMNNQIAIMYLDSADADLIQAKIAELAKIKEIE